MISRLHGTLIEKKGSSLLLETSGLTYEVWIPVAVMQGIGRQVAEDGTLRLVTFHYHHVEPSRSTPVLIGFTNEVERDFFEIFITVSGIGPRAALRAINQPICMIARAIDDGNLDFLRSLPGIGPQRAKEIVAKLQGKVGKYALMPDAEGSGRPMPASDTATEALEVLLQLQYRRAEAQVMIKNALSRNANLKTAEEILNEVYKQRVKGELPGVPANEVGR